MKKADCDYLWAVTLPALPVGYHCNMPDPYEDFRAKDRKDCKGKQDEAWNEIFEVRDMPNPHNDFEFNSVTDPNLCRDSYLKVAKESNFASECQSVDPLPPECPQYVVRPRSGCPKPGTSILSEARNLVECG